MCRSVRGVRQVAVLLTALAAVLSVAVAQAQTSSLIVDPTATEDGTLDLLPPAPSGINLLSLLGGIPPSALPAVSPATTPSRVITAAAPSSGRTGWTAVSGVAPSVTSPSSPLTSTGAITGNATTLVAPVVNSTTTVSGVSSGRGWTGASTPVGTTEVTAAATSGGSSGLLATEADQQGGMLRPWTTPTRPWTGPSPP